MIESYPGAAQDIMRIPRKSAGSELVKVGIERVWHIRRRRNSKGYHDELDAITSALVGVFHWVGMSEELGTEEEEALVLPCKVRRAHSSRRWDKWTDRSW